MRFFLRVVFTAIAIWLVSLVVGGISVTPYEDTTFATIVTFLLVALVFGVINASLGNLIRIVAFPLYILTLGLIALIVNGFLLMIVHWISDAVGFGLTVDGFWWGVLGALLISFVTWLITAITRPVVGKEKQRKR
ncbi:phage holin family protein [Humidisolicoccus flavus]|uniref:phage holin family protein n=1 Tax=Humidisolicoccus flavus TaxID=3111414 RepID=UPI0032532430